MGTHKIIYKTALFILIITLAYVIVGNGLFYVYFASALSAVYGYYINQDNKISIHAVLKVAGPFIILSFMVLVFWQLAPNNGTAHPAWRTIATAITFSILSAILSYGLTLIKRFKYREWMFWGILLLVFCAYFGSRSYAIQYIVTGILYMIASYILFYKQKKASLLGPLFLYLPFALIYTTTALIAWRAPVFPILAIVPLSVFVGIQMAKLHNHKKHVALVSIQLLYLVFVMAGYYGVMNWFSFLNTRQTQTISSIALKNALESSGISKQLVDQSQSVTIATPRMTVLYFFTQLCSGCFKKFPDLEQFHQAYMNVPEVTVFAVYVHKHAEDTSFNFGEYQSHYGYTFPFVTVGADQSKSLEMQLKILSYPHTMIFDNEFRIVQTGGFYPDDYYYFGNINRAVDAMLNRDVIRD